MLVEKQQNAYCLKLSIGTMNGYTKESKMTLSEEAMSYLEEHIPELANVAFKQAYWAALASGSSVLVSENGKLVEVFPDGRNKFIKHLAPSISVNPGQRFEINE